MGVVKYMVNRLKEDLVETGKFGRTPPKRIERYDQLDPKKGVSRPAGTGENRKIRDYAVERMKEAGLSVRIDKVGNIFGRKEGSKTNKDSVMCGSHLDSVINGGMFDGALGVFSAIEAVRRMNDEGFENERSLEVVVFTAEEGSAFSPTLLGSSVLVGKLSVDEALNRKNAMGQTLEEALENIGYKGSFERSLDDVEYFVEMHIEQGPVLDTQGISVGIVESIAGIAWIMATILGEENHAGTTPMRMRKDALVAASDIISFINERASEMVEKLGASTVGTVGKLSVFPNGTNIVPGKVEMGIDIRDVVEENMEHLTNETLQAMKDVEKKYGVDIRTELLPMHMPTRLSAEVIDIIDNSARQLGIVPKRMNSGAGHDSQNMAERVNTGMIFVPSVNGISHAPMEWTSWEDIENGVKVLTQTLKTCQGYREGSIR
ncbi:M20 family metallo-hydrolase [Dehalococcoidia bacterium]|nr:M20 family metallo-hydrolase [Dehalococcoidia bacterium]